MTRAGGGERGEPYGRHELSRRELLLRAATGLAAGAVGAGVGGCGADGAGAGGGGGQAVRMVAIGDWGSGGRSARSVAAAVRRFAAREHVDLLVTLGDNNYADTAERFEARWAEYYGWVRPAGIGVAGSLGNHDVELDDGRYEFRTLGMPGPYYRRRVGPVDLIVLDSNDVDARQTRWLQRALATSTNRWRIAVFHHPVHTCGRYRSRHFDVEEWVPLLEDRVHLVINGHDHNYQRLEDGPLTYVVAGGGGASIYDLDTCPAVGPVEIQSEAVHSFLTLRADADGIQGRALTVDGAVLDRFAIA
jgi:hypothetical protein